jgi:hypothetical protein
MVLARITLPPDLFLLAHRDVCDERIVDFGNGD